MKILNSKNKEIIDLKTWRANFFTDRKSKHWKNHRSAKSTAEYWLASENIESLEKILKNVFPNLHIDVAYPECELKFDDYSHPRENDILALDNTEKLLISVEAKTDESFGKGNFIEAMNTAFKEKKKNPSSKQVERLLGLYKNYFCCNDEILFMMHQLTYWFAGTIAEAKRRNYSTIVLLNQVFIYPELDEEKLKKNHNDFEYFVNIISNSKITNIACNRIIGPINNEYTQGCNVYILKQTVSD